MELPLGLFRRLVVFCTRVFRVFLLYFFNRKNTFARQRTDVLCIRFPLKCSSRGSARDIGNDVRTSEFCHRSTDLLSPRGKAFRVDISRGTTERFAQLEGHVITQLTSEGNDVLWTLPGGRSTIVMARCEVQKCDSFFRIDLFDGSMTELLEEGKCYSCTVAAKGRLLVAPAA